MTLTAWLSGLISLIIGGILAALLLLIGVNQLEPPVKQSDAPLIVYGSSS